MVDRPGSGHTQQKRGELIAGLRIGAQWIGLRPRFRKRVIAVGCPGLQEILVVAAELGSHFESLPAVDPGHVRLQAIGVVGLVVGDLGSAQFRIRSQIEPRELQGGELGHQRRREAKLARVEAGAELAAGKILVARQAGAEIDQHRGAHRVGPIRSPVPGRAGFQSGRLGYVIAPDQ